MLKRIAYWIVLKDLAKCNMFTGIYDARSGSDKFMYGVSVVMESIAYKVGERIGDKFADEFADNMISSKRKAERKEDEMHFNTDRPLNEIKINGETVMNMEVGNGWTITDVWFDHDVPIELIDCIKVKFERT